MAEKILTPIAYVKKPLVNQELMRRLEMKKCPFCGNSVRFLVMVSIDNTHYIRCLDCEATGPEGSSEQNAQDRWNYAQRLPWFITMLWESLKGIYHDLFGEIP